jgi:hypothetical protein
MRKGVVPGTDAHPVMGLNPGELGSGEQQG